MVVTKHAIFPKARNLSAVDSDQTTNPRKCPNWNTVRPMVYRWWLRRGECLACCIFSHGRSRRQNGTGKGSCRGSFFQSAQPRGTHRMPSGYLQSQSCLRPLFFEGFGFRIIGTIFDGSFSVSLGARWLLERLRSIALAAVSP